MLPSSDADLTVQAALTVPIIKHIWQVYTSQEKEKQVEKKKEQEAVPVQSRAQLIQPVGVCGISQFGQSIHSLHNDFQHVTDFPQHPTGFDSTKHWKAQTVKGS